MRFAIFGDIHANYHALEVILTDAKAHMCSHYVCMGDIVGYNAFPKECIEVVRKLECPVVKGNHDEQASMLGDQEGFNPLAEEAINWTREQLSNDDKEWLRSLRLQRQVRDFTIVHATLDTPHKWGYVFNQLDAAASFNYQHTALCFIGHTHSPKAYVRDGSVRIIPLDVLALQHGKKYLINVGSVGQPRDGDWRAAYCIFDTSSNEVQLRRIDTIWPAPRRQSSKPACPDGSLSVSLWGARTPNFPRTRLAQLKTFLLIKPGSFGDIIHAIPCAAALKEFLPDTRIAWLVDERWEPLLKDNPAIDITITFPREKFRGIAGMLRSIPWAVRLKHPSRRRTGSARPASKRAYGALKPGGAKRGVWLTHAKAQGGFMTMPRRCAAASILCSGICESWRPLVCQKSQPRVSASSGNTVRCVPFESHVHPPSSVCPR